MTNDRERKVTVLLGLVVILAASASGVSVAGSGPAASHDAKAGAAIQETTTEQGTATDQETTTAAGETVAISVRNLSAPDRIQLGEPFTVSADVVNDDDRAVVRQVTYRIAGTVVGSDLVQLPASETTTVMFDVTGANTTGFPTGTYDHGVFTSDAEATVNVTLTDGNESQPSETTGVATTAAETTPTEETTPVEATPDETTQIEATTDETTLETTLEGTEEAGEANVTFRNQTSDGTTVVVNSVRVPESGFVVVHDGSIFQGDAVESMLGTSAFLPAGSHENVTVELDDPLSESQRLVAVAYRDSNGNEEYDFVSSNRTADGPYRVSGGRLAVSDVANVTLADGDDQ